MGHGRDSHKIWGPIYGCFTKMHVEKCKVAVHRVVDLVKTVVKAEPPELPMQL